MGGHCQQKNSQRLEPPPSRVLSGEVDNHLQTNSCLQIVFVRFTQKRDQCIHKTSCSEFNQKKLFCENPSNALACIPLTPIMQSLFDTFHNLENVAKIDLNHLCYNC